MDQILKILLDNLSVFLSNVLVGILPILSSLAAAWLIAQVKLVWQEWRVAHTATADVLAAAAKMAVLAAEQLGLNKQIEDKKDYAVEVVKNYIAKLGLTIDIESILAAVEAAVMEQFNQYKDKE